MSSIGATMIDGRTWTRTGVAIAYGAIGVAHLVITDKLLPMMPSWAPEPRLTIIATGLCEIVGAIALCTKRFRRAAGWALAAYAICVFPANIKHAFEGVSIAGLPDSWWYHAPRLALQPVIIWATLYGAGLVNQPAKSK